MTHEPIAIIGLGCRFPGGAHSPEAYWRLLREGRRVVRKVPAERWSWRHFHDSNPDRPGKGYFHQGAFLDTPIDRFDAAFFGILPVEARVLDPQIRLILEVVWEAFENAGSPPERHRGEATGVYLSSFIPDYFLLQGQNFNAAYVDSLHATGTSLAMVANRVSYTYDFRGPSLALDTACSGSHSAIYSACQEIWNGSVQLAVAGGVSLMAYPNTLAPLCRSRFLSPDGASKAFDARADGYGRGEGAGVVLLCPLSLARSRGHRIQGLILSAHANQDGRTAGISVPSFEAQRSLVEMAWKKAGIDPGRAGYVEAHGTGTAVGDPIEARALAETIGRDRMPDDACFIGSAKANIGHLEAAAGVASVIKTVLALQHREIPPLAGFCEANPAIPFEEYRLRLPRQLEAWDPGNGPRVAGVNGFGYGGSNCHLVLQEAPDPDRTSVAFSRTSEPKERCHLLTLSARSPEALVSLAPAYADLIDHHPVEAICHSAALHRGHHRHRAALVGTKSQIQEALQALSTGASHELLLVSQTARTPPRIAFIFTGMGPQTWDMGRGLLHEPVFRQTLEEIDAVLRPLAGWSVLDQFSCGEPESRLREPAIAQTANFALQAGLFNQLKAVDIEPASVAGHSVGEVTAAWAAGCLTLEEAVRVSYVRGSLQQKRADDSKGMLATGLTTEEAVALLKRRNGRSSVDIAALNGPHSTTLTGPMEGLRELAEQLERSGTFHRLMHTRVAYHSRDMDALEEALLERLQTVAAQSPRIPFYSTALGRRLESAPDAGYWWQNVRRPVLFEKAVEAMAGDGHDCFLEIGPHPVLSTSLRQIFSRDDSIRILSTLRHSKGDRECLLACIGALYTLGIDPDWSALHSESDVPLIDLPLYPWQRERHWFESPGLKRWTHPEYVHALLGQKENLPDPAWRSDPSFTLHPWIPDHQVAGQPVFPAAAWLEMALAAAREQAPIPGSSLALESILFSEALLLDPGSRPYPQLLVQITGRDHFEIHSQLPDEEAACRWRTHVGGRILPPSSHRPEHTPEPEIHWNELTSRFAHTVDAGGFREHIAPFNFQYGPSFQGVQEMHYEGRAGCALIRLNPDLSAAGDFGKADWLCHPCLLDAAFQTLLFLVAANGIEGGDWLPVSVEQLVFFQPAGDDCRIHSQLTESGPDRCTGDLHIYRPDGPLALRVIGVCMRRIGTAGGRKPLRLECAYDEAWNDFTPAEDGNPTPHGSWHIAGDVEHPWFRQLQEILNTRAVSFPLNGTGHQDLSHAVYVATGLTENPAWTEDPAALVADAGLRFLDFVRGILPGATPDRPVRVLVLTCQAQRVLPSDPAPDLLSGALWGSIRSVMKERSDLDLMALDLPGAGEEPRIEHILQLFEGTPMPREAAWRGGRFLVREIRRLDPDDASARETFPFHPDDGSAVAPVLEADRPGDLNRLRFHQRPRRTPAPGELELRVHSAALNFKDVLKAAGLAPDKLLEDSISGRRLGLECSGTVLHTAAGSSFKPGDRVLTWSCYDSMATHLTVPENRCIRLPDAISLEIGGAQIPLITAWHALHGLARLQPGETVLIHSAAGGVGHYAVEIARDIGAKIVATAGSEEKRLHLRELGIPCVSDSRSLDFGEEIWLYTGGRGVDVVLNALTGEAFKQSLQLLAAGGRFVEIGKHDILANHPLELGAFHRNLSFFSVDLDRDDRHLLQAVPEYLEKAWEKIRSGRIRLPAIKSFPASGASFAFRYMAEARQIGRVSLKMQDEPIDVLPRKYPYPMFRTDRSYWITGGLGEVGFELARWLVANGARHITLTGRREPDPDRQEELRTLNSDITPIENPISFLPCDVASPEDCRRILEHIQAKHPPLAGIFHAAGTVEDTFIHEMTRAKFLDPLQAKVRGTWNLHRLTRNLDLDHFVLISSIASGWGSPGQANYAAGNAFMDALAEQRLSQGLPAASIHFGALAGKRSMAERFHEHAGTFFKSIGLPLLPVPDALELLGHLLRRGRARFTLADVDWPTWMKGYPHQGDRIRFGQLAEQSDEAERRAIAGSGFTRNLQEAAPEEQTAVILQHLLEIIAAETRLPLDRIDPDFNLREFGIDSLSSVSIDIRIREAFGVTIPFLQLFQEPDLKAIANKIQQRL